MMQEEDTLNQTPDHKNAFSIVTKLQKGKLNFWGDLSFSSGYGTQRTLGASNSCPRFHRQTTVFSYTHAESEDSQDVDEPDTA